MEYMTGFHKELYDKPLTYYGGKMSLNGYFAYVSAKVFVYNSKRDPEWDAWLYRDAVKGGIVFG